VAWKIDLSKAYNRVRWDFLEGVLREIMLPEATIKLIISCVSAVQFQVNVNGERGETRGPPFSVSVCSLFGKADPSD